MNYQEWKVDVPEGTVGSWRVERFTVSEEQAAFDQLRARINPQRGQMGVAAGTYTRLMRNTTVVMSDTPDEIRDHRLAVIKANGDVLLNGLGLGMVLRMIARKPEVRSVTVVEISREVIGLVADHYQAMFPGKITIIHADALAWKPRPGARYGAVWHDIWDYICDDNRNEMTKLHRRYARRSDWQGSWRRDG